MMNAGVARPMYFLLLLLLLCVSAGRSSLFGRRVFCFASCFRVASRDFSARAAYPGSVEESFFCVVVVAGQPAKRPTAVDHIDLSFSHGDRRPSRYDCPPASSCTCHCDSGARLLAFPFPLASCRSRSEDSRRAIYLSYLHQTTVAFKHLQFAIAAIAISHCIMLPSQSIIMRKQQQQQRRGSSSSAVPAGGRATTATTQSYRRLFLIMIAAVVVAVLVSSTTSTTVTTASAFAFAPTAPAARFLHLQQQQQRQQQQRDRTTRWHSSATASDATADNDDNDDDSDSNGGEARSFRSSSSSSPPPLVTSRNPHKLSNGRGTFLGFRNTKDLGAGGAAAAGSLLRGGPTTTRSTQLQSQAQPLMPDGGLSPCVIRVLGVGGGGCNAVRVYSYCRKKQ